MTECVGRTVGAVSPLSDASRRGRAAVLELGVVASVFLLYRWGRVFTRDATDVALANAERVADLERALGLHTEASVQAWVLDRPGLIELLNHYYVAVHFPATVALLLWVYVRHPGVYRTVRNWFVGVTLAALVIHVLFPLAPPRMTEGFVDTLDRFGPNIYSDDPRRSVANQFAAMPSLHFGWALMVGMIVTAVKRNRLARLALLHPAITLVAIVATGNHYWMDAIVAALLAIAIAPVVVWWGARCRRGGTGTGSWQGDSTTFAEHPPTIERLPEPIRG